MVHGLPATVKADVLHHARSRASGANVHKVESVIQVYVFACEVLQQAQSALSLTPRAAGLRRRFTEARAGVARMEAELWAM